MYQNPRVPLRVSVIIKDAIARASLIAELSLDPRLRIVAEFETLLIAYAPTEASPPDVVFCCKETVRQAEFAMFQALLEVVGGTIFNTCSGDGAAPLVQALGLPARVDTTTADADTIITPKRKKLVVIGSSTGGIEALSQILPTFPEDCPPTVIVQHIKPSFLDHVVARLDRTCSASVQTAVHGQKLGSGQVVFAPGRPSHLEVNGPSLQCRLFDGPPTSGHRPSIDVLFHSAARFGSEAVGVILTGMGRDGVHGLGAMRQAGAWTIGQDAATSTVFGMPRVAQRESAVCEVLPLCCIGKAILKASGERSRKELQ